MKTTTTAFPFGSAFTCTKCGYAAEITEPTDFRATQYGTACIEGIQFKCPVCGTHIVIKNDTDGDGTVAGDESGAPEPELSADGDTSGEGEVPVTKDAPTGDKDDPAGSEPAPQHVDHTGHAEHTQADFHKSRGGRPARR